MAVAAVSALRLVDRGRRIAPNLIDARARWAREDDVDRIHHQGQTAANPPGNGRDTYVGLMTGKEREFLRPVPRVPINRRLV